MNSVEQQRANMVAEFQSELASLRNKIGESSWGSLLAAIEPALLVLAKRAKARDSAEEGEWKAAVQALDPSVANDLSEVVKRFSLALKEHDRAAIARERCVSEAIAFLYTDVARPLWQCHPSLEPPELRRS
jgi:hypothetical protein